MSPSAVHAVRRNEGKRHLGGDGAGDHFARDLGFGGKTDPVRDMRRFQAFASVRPFLRQIKRPVDESMAMARHICGEHADLAVGDLARRASVLPRHSARRPALLQKTGFVDNQNRVRIAQRLQRIFAHDVAQARPHSSVRVPGSPAAAMGQDHPPPPPASSPSCAARCSTARPETGSPMPQPGPGQTTGASVPSHPVMPMPTAPAPSQPIH